MNSTKVTASDLESVELALGDDLARGDAVLSTATPILHHLLANEDQALFGDEVVARVRGMLTDLARQMLVAQADAADVADRSTFVDDRSGKLAAGLAEVADLLGHLHALTIEGQIARKLHQRTGIDPVLSPLLQELVASGDDGIASSAMAVITAQARFMHQQNRMALPLGDLPGDLFHAAITALRRHGVGGEGAEEAAGQLRAQFDESLGRLGLLSRLITAMGKGARRALDIDTAGLAIFTSGLAMAAGQGREMTMLSFSERQFARLALALRAAGLQADAIEEQCLYLHPDMSLPEGFDGVNADRAAALLSDSTLRSGR